MITTSQILSARQAAGLSQAKAAALIGYSLDAWIQWERGRRGMHASIFELFLLKSGQHPDYELIQKETIVDNLSID